MGAETENWKFTLPLQIPIHTAHTCTKFHDGGVLGILVKRAGLPLPLRPKPNMDCGYSTRRRCRWDWSLEEVEGVEIGGTVGAVQI